MVLNQGSDSAKDLLNLQYYLEQQQSHYPRIHFVHHVYPAQNQMLHEHIFQLTHLFLNQNLLKQRNFKYQSRTLFYLLCSPLKPLLPALATAV